MNNSISTSGRRRYYKCRGDIGQLPSANIIHNVNSVLNVRLTGNWNLDQFAEAIQVEEICKQATAEIMFWDSQLPN